MQRPIEKLGWHKRQFNDICESYYKGENWLKSSIYISFNVKNGDIVDFMNDEYVPFEELQAIYETAKQIKEENRKNVSN